MHSIGIYSRLDQVFNAPNAVKEVLTSQFGLDRSVSSLSFLVQFVMYLTEPHEVGEFENVVYDHV